MIRRAASALDAQDVAVLLGLALVTTGVALIHPPSAFIVSGGAITGWAVFGGRMLR